MATLPKRKSLVLQLAEILEGELRGGRWSEWLPEERELAKAYQVSRFTLRKTLEQLRRDGLIETKHGLGTRVNIVPAAPPQTANATVGVLLPRALYKFRHFTTLVVDDLRTLLIDHGHRLVIHEHPQVEQSRPFEFLRKLVDQQRHACWYLIACGPDTQRWFADNKVPAVVSGSCKPNLGLPFVCLDNHALGRHAGLTMLRYGHRHAAALLTRSNVGLRTGLNDVYAQRSGSGEWLTVCDVDESVASVTRAIDRLISLGKRPTAIFAAESNIYLAAFSRLSQVGLRVPQDMSLLCRDDEPYMASLVPSPSRYSKDPHAYARLSVGFIRKLIAHEVIENHAIFVMPEFVSGASIARIIKGP